VTSLSLAPSPLKPVSTTASGGPLGTTAKSSSPPPDRTKARASRALKYQALSHAAHILRKRARRLDPSAYPGDRYRTCDCRHHRHSDVEVMRSLEHGSAFYAGLVTCGSVWACPVCASRIQERRRLEIEHAIDWAKAEGLTPVLVTFTFPHHKWNSLRDLISQQREAFKILRRGRAWMKVKPAGGLIRSLEVTHGEANGWHPHTHELWFCDPANIPDHPTLVPLWESACRRSGLLSYRPDDPRTGYLYASFLCNSIVIQDTDRAVSDYLAKQDDDANTWGPSHEIAKATSKEGRAKGVHPHRFLTRKAPGDEALFLEYVDAMKGARQLFWSPGLKARCGLLDQTDEQLAEESRDNADCLAHLTDDQWQVVRGNDARAELLDAAESGGLPAVRALLASLGAPVPSVGYPSAPDGLGRACGAGEDARARIPAPYARPGPPGREGDHLGTRTTGGPTSSDPG